MTDETTNEATASIETKKDLGTDSKAIVKRWKMEVRLAQKVEADWVKDAKRVKKRYRNKSRGSNKFNILWSNTETMRPALFSSAPEPDVRRRFRDEDPVGKEIAEIAERALSFSVDDGDLEGVIDKVVLDHLLVGRGIPRVRYVPTFKKEREEIDLGDSILAEDDEREIQTDNDGRRFVFGDEFDQLVFEEVKVELVRWDRFNHGPATAWKDVPWIKFDHLLSRDQLKKAFPGIGATLDLNRDMRGKDDTEGEPENDSDASSFKRADVWEIWDLETRKIIWIAPHYPEGPLKVEDDPLGLNQFFPIPEPLYSIDDTDTLIPIPEFTLYEDQAKELDQITDRINKLIKGLKARGIYDSTLKSVERLEVASDNEMIPVEEVAAMLDRGGLKNAIWMYPIDTLTQVLKELYIQRDQIRATIFEITGISDIQRGVSDPNETARAQSIKSRFGTQRLGRRQRNVAKLVRNTIRLMAEIMMENFKPETIQMMTGKQITPEMQEIMQRDGAREFRIDIETDSTIANQQEADEANITKLLTGMGGFMNSIAPAVQGGVISLEAATAILLGAVRKFKFGRQVEDALLKNSEKAKNVQDEGQGQDKGPTPEQIEAQRVQQETAQKGQLEQDKLASETSLNQDKLNAEMDIKRESVRARSSADANLEREKALIELEIKREEMQLKAQNDELAIRLKAEVEAQREPVGVN